jgi:hypothetical protein
MSADYKGIIVGVSVVTAAIVFYWLRKNGNKTNKDSSNSSNNTSESNTSKNNQ